MEGRLAERNDTRVNSNTDAVRELSESVGGMRSEMVALRADMSAEIRGHGLLLEDLIKRMDKVEKHVAILAFICTVIKWFLPGSVVEKAKGEQNGNIK